MSAKNQARPPVARPTQKLRGRPMDSMDTQISKTLAYILRHGAKNEGVAMRPDGYVRVRDLLSTPRMSSVDFGMIERIVQADLKSRYHLIYEADPSDAGLGDGDGWWIRANQGHSMKNVSVELTPITSVSDVPTGMAVHGTTMEAWRSIEIHGLSRMTRNHIHLAQGVSGSGVLSGMRTSSKVLIYIDLPRALADGILFFLSANGVVLTPGDTRGFLSPRYFSDVTNQNGLRVKGWTPIAQMEELGIGSGSTGSGSIAGSGDGKGDSRASTAADSGSQGAASKAATSSWPASSASRPLTPPRAPTPTRPRSPTNNFPPLSSSSPAKRTGS